MARASDLRLQASGLLRARVRAQADGKVGPRPQVCMMRAEVLFSPKKAFYECKELELQGRSR